MEPRRNQPGWLRGQRQCVVMRSRAKKLGGKKNQEEAKQRVRVCWPVALRKVRAWLEPWLMLGRYWRAWSPLGSVE
jgi:hypothetical protein